MKRISRRFFPFAGILGLSLLSCGREVTGPADGLWFGRNPTAALAIDPRFPQLPGGNFASDLVPFVRVRVTVRNLDDKVVKDTTVDFPSTVDSIALTLTVPLPSSTAAGGVPLTLTMAFVNAAGDTVFRGGPSAIIARPRGAAGASQPIVIPVAWVPPGAVPASVVLTPTTGSVVSGTTTVFRATALDAAGDSIPNTPIVFTVDTAARATLVTVGRTSTATWQANPGNVRIIASTLNVRADTSFFVVSLPVSTQLVITTAPTAAVAGITLSAITVAVRDASNALTPLFTGPVTLTLNAGATGATLAGTATVNAVAGIATFNGLSIQRAATGLTLTASSGALTPATSAALTITTAAPAALVTLAGNAQSGTLGQPLTDSVDVQLRDAFANPIVGSSIAFSVTSGGGSISPTSVVTDANGRARARWTLGTSVGAQTARAQLVGVPAVFAAVGATGVPGAPVRLEIVTEPAATQVAGVAIAPAIAVRVVDAVGVTVTSFTGTVGLVLAANPGATTPTGVLSIAAVAGVASFTNVAVPAAAVGYTLAATSGALTPDTTVAFTVLSAVAAQMVLVSGAGQSATVGTAVAAPLVVRITDAFGNGVPGFAVNWSVTTGTGTLGSASSATNATGFASNTLTVSSIAGAVVVSATAGGVTGSPQQFAATALVGAVTQLAYTLNTGGGTAGAPITPGWVIQARDAQANLVTGFNGPVTVALSNGPGGATLGGTTTVNAVGGIATFANLTVDRIASSWVLIASSPGLSNALSAAFFITPAAAAAIAVQAGDAQTAAVLTQVAGQITFRVSDAFGNPTNGTALTVTVTSGGGSVGTASGVTNVAGELSTTWTLGNTLGAQSVTATVTLTPALQAVATATATPGAATTLVITTGPIGPQVAGVPLQDVVVQARDGAGNLATGFTGTVRALVGGTVPDSAFATAVGGVATFTGAFFETSGTFFVRFSAPGLTEAVSDTFAVTPAAATQMVLSSGNGQSGIAGQLLPLPVVVRIEDPFLNRVPGVTVSWVMSRGVDTLAVNTNVSDANGLATWRPTLPTSVTAVQIIARSTGLINSPITISSGVTGDVTTQLTMFTQPSGAFAGATLPPSAVRARDQYGNFKVNFTGTVTAAIDSGPAGAILSGTTTVAAVGGTATFSTLALNVSGTYRLRYSSGALTNAVSTAFTVIAGTPASIVLVAGGAQSGSVTSLLTDSVAFRVTDGSGNRVPGVLIGITVTTGGGVVSTTAGVTDAAGEIRTAWTLGAPLGAQSITATVSAVPALQAVATATATAGAANQLAVTTPAAGATSGAAFATQPVVAVRDAVGNLVATDNSTIISMVVSSGGTVVGTATASAVNGVATFATVGISGLVATYTLTFNATGLNAATQTVVLVAGAPSALAVNVELGGAVAGEAISAITVSARDAAGNVATGFITSVTASIDSGTAGAVLSGTLAPSAVAGTASFGDLSLNLIGTYRLRFTAPGLTAAVSTDLTVSAGAPSSVIIVAGGAQTASASSLLTDSITVRLRDALNNPIAGTIVDFFVSTGGGSSSPLIAATNVSGEARTAWTLGAVVGTQQMIVTVPGFPGVQVTVSATATGAGITWSGGAATSNWATAANWAGGVVPTSTDSVSIPAAVATLPQIPVGITLRSFVTQHASQITALGTLTITENLRTPTSTGGIACSGGGVTFNTPAAKSIAGRLDGCLVRVLDGTLTATDTLLVGNSDLQVEGTAIFDAGADRVTVDLVFSTLGGGRLRMNNDSAHVQVSGGASFGGGSTDGLLTSGLLVLGANFNQAGSALSFAASGTHRTLFATAGAQAITFTNAGASASHFQDLEIGQASGSYIDLQTSAFVNGQLIEAMPTAARIRSANIYDQLVTRGVNVNGLRLDRVQWIINPGAVITQIANVVIDSLPASLAQIQISRPSGTVVFNGITFNVTPTTGGYYLSAIDSDGAANGQFTANVVNPTPVNHNGRILESGGAQITGWATLPLIQWTGAVSNNWGTAGNWNLGRLPIATDSVVIDLPGAYTVSLASASTVGWLIVGETGTPTFTFAGGGSLQVDSAAAFGATSTVNMATGSTLTGGGSVSFAGALNWNGGTMAGAGGSIVIPGATASIASVAAVTLNERTLAIGGTAIVGAAGIGAINTPTISVIAGGTMAFAATASFSSDLTLVNAGLVRKAASAGLVQVNWPIVNTGTIEVADDTLRLLNVLDHLSGTVSVLGNAALHQWGKINASAAVTIADGGVLFLRSGGIGTDAGNHFFGPTSSVTGLGTFDVNSADTVVVQGAFNVDSLLLLNALLEFNGTDTAFVTRGQYTGGGWLRGTGVLAIRGAFASLTGNVEGTGTISVLSTGTLHWGSPLRGWTLDVAGTMIWDDRDLSLESYLGQNARINILLGGLLDIQHGAAGRNIFGNTLNPMTNAGTIRKLTGAGTAFIRTTMVNTGTINGASGSIGFQFSCTNSGTLIGSVSCNP